jgi:catechol 2,3-dioxygenase-like lactoylglutathione lyase family enzyme
MATDHFGFTKLIVADLEKAASFYKAVCGLTELGRVDAAIEGRRISEIMFNATGEGAATFVLLSYPDAAAAKDGEVILGFITQDVEAFVARAQSAGGRIAQAIETQPQHGVTVGFVRDPEGHLIEVVELLPH